MLRPGVCRDWRMSWYAASNWWRVWSGVESGSLCMTLNRPAFLERDLVGLSMDGNW